MAIKIPVSNDIHGDCARQFVENHFADTTIGRIRLLVDATFRQERHLVEKNSQVRHSVEIVKSLFFRPNVLLNGTSHLPNVTLY